MTYLKSVIIGVIQGLTEFLPVSSSGHILLAEKILHVNLSADTALLFSVLLHCGTLLAVLISYRKDIMDMIRHPLSSNLKWLIVATIPAVIAALLIDFDEAFKGAFLGWSFLCTSAIMIVGEAINRHKKNMKDLHRHVHFTDALVMGIMQAVAILPGVSRSGSTIAGGAACGLSRRRAANFAFLMSIPAILGSLVLELKDILFAKEAMHFDLEFSVMAAGTVAAFVMGFLAIQTMIRTIRRLSLNWFAAYTLIVGVLVLLDQYKFHYFL